MSAELGQGLSVLEHVLIEESSASCALGSQLVPGGRTARVHAVSARPLSDPNDCQGAGAAHAVTEEQAGPDPSGSPLVPNPAVPNGEKWFVTSGDVGDFLIVLARVARTGRVRPLSRGQGHPENARQGHVALDAHVGVLASRLQLRCRTRAGGGLRAGRPEVRTGQALVSRGAPDDCHPVPRRSGASAAKRRVGHPHATSLGAALPVTKSFRPPGGLDDRKHADSTTENAVNRAFARQVAADVDRSSDRKLLHARATKLSASETAGRVVDRAVQIFYGCMLGYAVGRLYRKVLGERI
jgi:acyl-CoA dehydrogenase